MVGIGLESNRFWGGSGTVGPNPIQGRWI